MEYSVILSESWKFTKLVNLKNSKLDVGTHLEKKLESSYDILESIDSSEEKSLEELEKLLSNKSFLINMKKIHNIETSRSYRQNLLTSSRKAIEEIYKEKQNSDRVNEKFVGQALSELKIFDSQLEEYIHQVESDKLSEVIGKSNIIFLF